MQKSKIEWTDYTLNPVKGLCPMACWFKWNEKITLTSRWDAGLEHIKPSRIFIGSTFELFGGFIPDEWLSDIFLKVKLYPWHTFIFLTKCPQNLPKQFPDNCWVGVSATNQADVDKRLPELCKIDAPVRFVSCEPLLSQIDLRLYLPSWGSAGTTFENPEGLERFDLDGSPVNPINWLIIGQQTPVKKTTQPKVEWVKEIVDACDNAKIPVFLKNNLTDLLVENDADWAFDCTRKLRQEMPVVSP
jgi:protein gp37